MTVSSTTSYIEYEGDGTADEFPIPFAFLDDSTYIHVYDVTLGIATKTEYAQGTEYTVTGIPSNPAVTFSSPPADGARILVRRELPVTQLTSYTPGGAFPAASHEAALDKLTMLLQDLSGLLELGDYEAASYMTLGSDGNWNAEGLEISSGAPGTGDSSFATVAQVLSLISGTVPVPISGQTAWIFVGDDSTTDFELDGSVGHLAQDFVVAINGVVQVHGSSYAYTVTNNGTDPDELVFSTAPPTGAVIQVRIPTGTALAAASTIVLDDGNVADSSLSVVKLSPGTAGQFIVTSGGVAAWATLTASMVSDLATYLAALPVSTFAAATGSVNLNSNKVTNLAAGTASGDAVNKAQLDAVTPFKRQSGATTWAGSGATRTMTIDFPFSVGTWNSQVSMTFSGVDITTIVDSVSLCWTGSNPVLATWRSRPLNLGSAAVYLELSVTRSSISGGTRLSFTLTLVGGGSISSINNVAYWAAEA